MQARPLSSLCNRAAGCGRVEAGKTAVKDAKLRRSCVRLVYCTTPSGLRLLGQWPTVQEIHV